MEPRIEILYSDGGRLWRDSRPMSQAGELAQGGVQAIVFYDENGERLAQASGRDFYILEDRAQVFCLVGFDEGELWIPKQNAVRKRSSGRASVTDTKPFIPQPHRGFLFKGFGISGPLWEEAKRILDEGMP